MASALSTRNGMFVVQTIVIISVLLFSPCVVTSTITTGNFQHGIQLKNVGRENVHNSALTSTTGVLEPNSDHVTETVTVLKDSPTAERFENVDLVVDENTSLLIDDDNDDNNNNDKNHYKNNNKSNSDGRGDNNGGDGISGTSSPYSVDSPFGLDGQPLLLDTADNGQGYKSVPSPKAELFPPPHRFDTPVRHNPTTWGEMVTDGEYSPPLGKQWVRQFDGDSRRMALTESMDRNGQENLIRSSVTRQNYNTDTRSPEFDENRQLVKEILTKALDILTLDQVEKKGDCESDEGSICKDGEVEPHSQNKKNRRGSNCHDKNGIVIENCSNYLTNSSKILSYADMFVGLSQRFSNSRQIGRSNDEGDGFESSSPQRRVSVVRSSSRQPKSRTAFRSVQTGSSSLARLLRPGGGPSDVNGGRQSSTINTGTASNNNNNGGNSGSGDIGGGGGSGEISQQNSGSDGSGGSGSSVPTSVSIPGVDLNVFNKFAMETIQFEQQSAAEIKRLDNLLRQLAVAAQSDFASVSSSVNSLQQELVQTQQQLVKAWSVLNSTHARDNSQTVGDLRDVKTDVYRLHALLTGSTPLGQGTAHGRAAAEVKEVAQAMGPGVDCAALFKTGVNASGVYDLQPDPSDNQTRMTAFCDMETDGGGWTLFQRRRDGSDDFFRGWNSYKHGFGSYRHDHWLGLENIHLLTKYGDNVMRIELMDWDNKTRWAEFSYTRIMDESDGYRILVGGYRGTAGDPFHSLSYSMRMQSMRFSTFDSDNDLDSGGNCALTFTSGWWFNKCFQVNLNGVWYGNSRYAGPSMNGIVWDLWPEHFNGYSLRQTEMKLRPADFQRKK